VSVSMVVLLPSPKWTIVSLPVATLVPPHITWRKSST
jgi:hypothetical protein